MSEFKIVGSGAYTLVLNVCPMDSNEKPMK